MPRLSVHLRSARDDSYKIVIEPGSLAKLPGRLLSLAKGRQIAVVTDRTVEKLYGKKLLRTLSRRDPRARLFSFPSGERAKTRRTKERLEDALLSSGYGRDTLLVALGGGVVGDLAGFLAATLHRGVPFVQVPTTLLAMADSSVGGKTAVDTPAGKNLIGAFWQPLEVVIDPLLLSTLPRRQIAAGAAEIAKHGVIADKALFHFVEKNLERLLAGDPRVVSRALLASCQIKAGVVSKDEREGGLRQILNFGHTIAHALELVRGYQLLHGEAVWAGMAVEALIAAELGVLSRANAGRIATLCSRAVPLPRLLNVSSGAVLRAALSDKKNRGGKIRYALPSKIGGMARSRSGSWTLEAPAALAGRCLERAACR